MQEVYDFLKAAETYYLATVEGDQPRVRPFATYDIFDEKIYIMTGRAKDVSKQIAANPKVELCAFKDGIWLRIMAEAVDDDRIEAKEHMLEEFPSLKELGYSADDGNMQVLYLKNAIATFSSFIREKDKRYISDIKVIEF